MFAIIAVLTTCLLSKYSLADWTALTPEETLHAYTTCFDDWAPDPKNQAARKETADTWFKQWQLSSKAVATHCFVKCTIEKLELYNAELNFFEVAHLETQRSKYQGFTKLSPQMVKPLKEELDKLKPTDKWKKGCTDWYNAFIPIFNKYPTVFRSLYHGYKNITDDIYKEMGSQLKQREESYINFCEKKFYPDRKKNLRLCNIRGYNLKVSADETLKKHIDCIFRGFRYVSKDGKFYAKEVIRDFHKINIDSSAIDNKIVKILTDCKDTSAYGYYVCLLKSELGPKFKVAMDYREIRSADYKSVIEGDKFNYDKVLKKQQEIAAVICPTQKEIDDMLRYTKDDYLTLGGTILS